MPFIAKTNDLEMPHATIETYLEPKSKPAAAPTPISR
ncbi:hypothetical protein FB566_1395 [Stackebrandtia endophytica]|uniref:Uncharacterized protein n=1 Tax=Stackebrandtia endophytica TaxID=1496996 RepID=A0A543ATG3_9ACTN|nr:hypothetical protein FB566_1395 [Stackebrandtia endophytica]